MGTALLTPANAPWASAVSAWWDANDSSTLTVVAGKVSQWNSKVGTGVAGKQTTAANQPLFSATAANGMPGLTFNGTTSRLIVTPVSQFVTDYSGSASGLAIVAGSHSDRRAIFAIGPNIGNGMRAYQVNNSKAEFEDYNGPQVGDSVPASTAATLVFRMDAQSASGTVAARSTVNGAAERTTSITYTAATNTTADIGFWTNLNGAYFDGIIQEIVYFSRAITVVERQQLEGYLAWKWGTQASLPANHPYANAAPTVSTTPANSDAAASGAIGSVAASSPSANAGGTAGATGALPASAAMAAAGSAQGPASATGAISPGGAASPQATVSGAAFATGAIAAAASLAVAAIVSGTALISGSVPPVLASPPAAIVSAGGTAQGGLAVATSNPPSANVGGDGAALGAAASALTMPPAASVSGDGGAYGAPAGGTATPPAGTAAVQAHGAAAGALPLLYASPPTATAGGASTASGGIAMAQSLPASATAGGTAVASSALPAAIATSPQAIVGGDGGATGFLAPALASPPAAIVSVTALGLAAGSPPTVAASAPIAIVNASSSTSASITAVRAQPLTAMVGAHSVATGSILGLIASPPQARVNISITFGAVARGWALLATPRSFTGIVERRIFAITIGGPSKMNFPPKFAAEVRNASVDFTPDLADGEELTDGAAVATTVGDIVISNVARDGAVVHFTMSGGTRAGGIFQTISVTCSTTQGQTLGETVSLALR